jgi:N6-adenosine-specific RNA methylase IME4
MRKMIDLVSYGNKIELFARQKTDGWDVWGNEVESDIIL